MRSFGKKLIGLAVFMLAMSFAVIPPNFDAQTLKPEVDPMVAVR